MMATWSDFDASTEENSKKEVNLYLMTNHSKVIDYYSNSECEDIYVQEALLKELSTSPSRIKELKKQVKVLKESRGKLQRGNVDLKQEIIELKQDYNKKDKEVHVLKQKMQI